MTDDQAKDQVPGDEEQGSTELSSSIPSEPEDPGSTGANDSADPVGKEPADGSNSEPSAESADQSAVQPSADTADGDSSAGEYVLDQAEIDEALNGITDAASQVASGVADVSDAMSNEPPSESVGSGSQAAALPDAPSEPSEVDQPTSSGSTSLGDAPIPQSAPAGEARAEVDLKQLELPDLSADGDSAGQRDISILRDVDLRVQVELGRTHMYIEDVLQLGEGGVVELDNLAGDPVDVVVNGRLIARGEVLVLGDNFCVRVNEIISGPQNVAIA